MKQKRIETTISRTAEMTCISRAASSLETNPYYHCDDYLALRLLPDFFRTLIKIPLFRRFFMRMMAPAGIYEYVIARTKYIDAAFEQALAEGYDQVLLFGAGFDTRALRFQARAQQTCIFELDAPFTQQAKIQQYKKRNLVPPANLSFISIDFDKEALPEKLDTAGFQRERRTLFTLEGVLMYLEPESVRATFQTIQANAGQGSQVVFDYVKKSVLMAENTVYGEGEIVQTVSKAGERWRFGIDPSDVVSFLATFGFSVSDHKCAQDLEVEYFPEAGGRSRRRINGTHCIVTAIRK